MAVFNGSETVYAARNESLLVLGIGDGGHYLASDVPAFIDYSDRVVYVEDGQFARIHPSRIVVTEAHGAVVETPSNRSQGTRRRRESGLRPLHAQDPRTAEGDSGVSPWSSHRIRGHGDRRGVADLDRKGPVQFVVRGTSYRAALYEARLLCERGISAQCFLASEYSLDSILVTAETLVVGVTQSGETADTMRALREANRAGAMTLALTNVVGNSAAREFDYVMYIRAGPEIGVAATKTFATQQVALAMLSSVLSGDSYPAFVERLRNFPDQIRQVLDESEVRAVDEAYEASEAYFFIGRRYNAPVALESAPKMKEITYKHAEGFAAGELRHGPLALVTERTPILAMVTSSTDTAKTLGNVKEVEARDALVIRNRRPRRRPRIRRLRPRDPVAGPAVHADPGEHPVAARRVLGRESAGPLDRQAAKSGEERDCRVTRFTVTPFDGPAGSRAATRPRRRWRGRWPPRRSATRPVRSATSGGSANRSADTGSSPYGSCRRRWDMRLISAASRPRAATEAAIRAPTPR